MFLSLTSFLPKVASYKKEFLKNLHNEKNLNLQKSLKEKNLFYIIFWNANFPPVLMIWKNTERCENWNSWIFRWFIFKKIVHLSKRQLQYVWRVKSIPVFASFFSVWFSQCGRKIFHTKRFSSTWILPIDFKSKSDVRSIPERTWKS